MLKLLHLIVKLSILFVDLTNYIHLLNSSIPARIHHFQIHPSYIHQLHQYLRLKHIYEWLVSIDHPLKCIILYLMYNVVRKWLTYEAFRSLLNYFDAERSRHMTFITITFNSYMPGFIECLICSTVIFPFLVMIWTALITPYSQPYWRYK